MKLTLSIEIARTPKPRKFEQQGSHLGASIQPAPRQHKAALGFGRPRAEEHDHG